MHRTYVVRPRPWSRPRTVEALRGVELELAAGEVLAVLGDSGSGKSTLARISAGLDAADRGRVRWPGLRQGERRADYVQFVFQEATAALDPRMTVREALEEPFVIARRPCGDLAARLLTRVQLDPSMLVRDCEALSGGQKQRVVLARALALEPRLLVLDEPTASLDASAAAHVTQLLRAVVAERGVSLLWVTHDVTLARTIADRVAVLERGRVVETGPADAVLSSPEHPYTAALVQAAFTPPQ